MDDTLHICISTALSHAGRHKNGRQFKTRKLFVDHGIKMSIVILEKSFRLDYIHESICTEELILPIELLQTSAWA